MASFHALPRELRDKILMYALGVQRRPPVSPADFELETRVQVQPEQDQRLSWYFNRAGFLRLETRPTARTLAALRLVSRRTRHEVDDAVRRAADTTPDCDLDIVFLTNGSIWPTWTRFPASARRRLGTVHVTFRLFACSPKIVALVEGKPYRIFRGGDGGPPFVVWIFYDLLTAFLCNGPWPTCAPRDTRGVQKEGITIQNLIIDVLPATENDILPLEKWTMAQLAGRGLPAEARFFSRFTARRNLNDDENRDGATRGAADARLEAAQQLAGFIRWGLGILAAMSYHTFGYGKLLYERLGSIDIRVDGKSIDVIDLSWFPLRVDFGTESLHGNRSREYASWVANTVGKRREMGLPVAPFTPEMQQYFAVTSRITLPLPSKRADLT